MFLSVLMSMILCDVTSIRSDEVPIELSVKTFQTELSFGESYYLHAYAKNVSDTTIEFFADAFNTMPRGDIYFSLRHGKEVLQVYEEDKLLMYYAHYDSGPGCLPLRSGEMRNLYSIAIQMPPLEDLHHPFWSQIEKSLSESDQVLSLDTTFVYYGDYDSIDDEVARKKTRTITLSQKVILKQRTPKERELLENWYHATPEHLFPKTEAGRWESSGCKVPPKYKIIKESKSVIRVGDETFSPWDFIVLGNRYPGDPNAPETWQGWKELEESLTPSTMRDEIRLTRILIQYCDTEDDAVLKELKDWFDGMNEVQRTVMVLSLRNRYNDCRLKEQKLLPLFREVYKAVREYDVWMVPLTESEALRRQYYRDLGLIE